MSNLTKNAVNTIIKSDVRAEFPYLIKITHKLNDGTENVYYLANSDTDITYDSHLYKASCFSIVPPEEKFDGFTNASLTLSAVDNVWIERIRSSQQISKIEFVAAIKYLNQNLSIEPREEYECILRDATFDDKSITWTLVFDELLEVNLPMIVIDKFNCSALA